MNRPMLCAAFAVPLLAIAPARAAEAQGLEALRRDIARAAQEDPKPFRALAALKRRLPQLDRRRRGPQANVVPLLKSLGPAALLPMLGELLEGAPAGAMNSNARKAWAVGLLEAVAALEHPRARLPVERMLVSETDPAVVRAAAAALGRVAGADAVAVLAPLAARPGPLQLSVVSGLAECRRAPAARALADLLATHPDAKVARAAAKALGEMASAWVWRMPSLAGRPDRAEVRSVAAQALVRTFAGYRGEVRTAAETALLVIDSPEARALVRRELQNASAEDRPAFERLSARLARSPVSDRD